LIRITCGEEKMGMMFQGKALTKKFDDFLIPNLACKLNKVSESIMGVGDLDIRSMLE
jgi:hypothetical protein